MKFLSVEQTASEILRLTRNMHRLAENNDWQEFASLESERQRSLEYLFQHPEITTALPALADTLHQVVSLDRESIHLGEAAKRLLAEKMDLESPMPGAINAYKNTSKLF